jgi:hypothetical protein
MHYGSQKECRGDSFPCSMTLFFSPYRVMEILLQPEEWMLTAFTAQGIHINLMQNHHFDHPVMKSTLTTRSGR